MGWSQGREATGVQMILLAADSAPVKQIYGGGETECTS